MPNERRSGTRLEADTLEQLNSKATTAYLGLGSNVGDREASLNEAVGRLASAPSTTILKSSSIYETVPWGFADQPDFLNCVLEIETHLSPLALLGRAKDIEQEVGRRPSWRYGPRLIDVDILLYGNETLQLAKPDLQIPHPRMDQRAFVVIPLAELAGDVTHPTLHRTISEIAEEVEGREGVRIWGPPLSSGRQRPSSP